MIIENFQAKELGWVSHVSNLLLLPARYLFGGRDVVVIRSSKQITEVFFQDSFSKPEQRNWLRAVLSIVFLSFSALGLAMRYFETSFSSRLRKEASNDLLNLNDFLTDISISSPIKDNLIMVLNDLPRQYNSPFLGANSNVEVVSGGVIQKVFFKNRKVNFYINGYYLKMELDLKVDPFLGSKSPFLECYDSFAKLRTLKIETSMTQKALMDTTLFKKLIEFQETLPFDVVINYNNPKFIL